MARTIAVIKQQIIDQKNALPSLAALNSPSQTAIWNLWAFVTAVCINLFEQLLDIFKTDIEGIVAQAGAGTLPWLRAQVLKFQYSTLNAQFVVLDPATLIMAYPIIDPSLQIITRVAVAQSASRVVTVKVAQQEPPVPIDGTQLTALASYIDEISFAGTEIIIVNKAADSLIVYGFVYYDGQYSSTIQTAVSNAISAYCQGLSSTANFGSQISVNSVINAILNVPGVIDFGPLEISDRPDGVDPASRTIIYDIVTGVDSVRLDTIAGYVVPETTAGYTLADTLFFNILS